MGNSENLKSRVISARLHPENEEEKRALNILEKKIKEGYSVRQIITDALIRADGYTPEMFSGSISVSQGQLERTLEDFADYILQQISEKGFSVQSKVDEKPSPFDNSEQDTDVMRNMAAGYLNRRKRG